MTAFKLNFNRRVIYVCLGAMLLCHFSFSQNKKDNYFRFIDSADIYTDDYYKKALSFLDSIPTPIEKSIDGRLAEYYSLKALIHDGDNEYAKLYQCYILSLKYAEKEKNYKLAGEACLELFACNYYYKKDTTAYKYLEKAKTYYSLIDFDNGPLEIDQTYAYAKFLDGDYKACNDLILKYFDDSINLKDENAYYYMFATYMLTSNYIYLGNLKEAYKYFNEFKSLENNQTIVKYNYLSFKATISSCFADIYFEKKQMDSTFYYLDELSALRNYMADDIIKYYFELNADIYKFSGDIDASKKYIDSLLVFEEKIFGNMVDASNQINTTLQKAEIEIETESKKKVFNGFLVYALFLLSACISIFYFIHYRKHKFMLRGHKNQESNFSYLKANNEKLTLKLYGLEKYISNVKKDVKDISSIDTSSGQREKIKKLYNDLRFDTSTLLDKTESHAELVNDLNVVFFNKMQIIYPQLNDSEIVICYYLLIGFKNKEIALFLNTSIRAIESKRYRISNKISLNKNDTTLVKHLKETFKEIEMND